MTRRENKRWPAVKREMHTAPLITTQSWTTAEAESGSRMSEHRPGPWKLGPYDSGPHEVHGHPVVTEDGLILAIASNNEATARLIASAPDLLAALRSLWEAHLFDMHDVDLGQDAPFDCATCAKARAALAKVMS